MITFSITHASERLAEIIEQIANAPVEITRHGEPVAVLVSPDHYRVLHDAWEDLEGIKDVDEALADSAPLLPWEEVARELGLE